MIIRLWILVGVLLTVGIIQLAQWRDVRKETRFPTTDAEYQQQYRQRSQWNKRVADIQGKRVWLENQLLWRNPDALLPVLSKGAVESEVRIIGVSPQPARYRKNYEFHPIELTILGELNGVASLLSVVESLSPTVRIDALHIKRFERNRGQVTSQGGYRAPLSLRLTLAPLVKVNVRGHPLTMRRIERFTIKRNPFETGMRPGGADLKLRPPTPHPNRATPLPTLTSILFSETKPLAILSLNGISHTVGVGDEIYGVKITHIHPHQVTVIRGTTPKTLSLWKSNESNHPKSTTPIAFGMED